MALKIRMARRGTTNRPFYHIVVADSRSPRDGAYLEKVGSYNPLAAQGSDQRLLLTTDRIQHWLSVGAQASDRVQKLLAQAGLGKAPAIKEQPVKSAPKKRAQERAADRADKAAALAEAANKPAEESPEADEAAA